jgi:hypothetical protein
MKRFSVIVLLVAAVYIGTYICLRTSHVDRWDRDVHNYVILPESRLIYYVYRPLTYIDAHLTGMRFTSATPLAIFARASNQSITPTADEKVRQLQKLLWHSAAPVLTL